VKLVGNNADTPFAAARPLILRRSGKKEKQLDEQSINPGRCRLTCPRFRQRYQGAHRRPRSPARVKNCFRHSRVCCRFSAAMKHSPTVTLSRRWLPTWTARLAIRGGPRCRAVPCVSRTLRQSEQGESIAEGQILRGIEIAYRGRDRFHYTRLRMAHHTLASAIVIWTEHRL
jgi:hypothetical protein